MGLKKNNKGTKDLLKNKGLHEIKEDIINAPWVPPPAMADIMKLWEEEFDNSRLGPKINHKKPSRKKTTKSTLKFYSKSTRNLKSKSQTKQMPVVDNETSADTKNLPYNSLNIMNKHAASKPNLSTNWHEYAEMRKSFLPTIFNVKEKYENNIKKPKLKKKKNQNNARSL
jgi:hypothetical protein